MAKLAAVFAENVDRLAQLANIPVEWLRAELETDRLAPFRYFSAKQLLALQGQEGQEQPQSLYVQSEEQLLAAINDSPQL